jgi:hypothetical protein
MQLLNYFTLSLSNLELFRNKTDGPLVIFQEKCDSAKQSQLSN